MIHLTNVLTALDPSATASLEVISHFDALIARRVGQRELLRSAATLAGVTAGMAQTSPLEVVQVDPSGHRVKSDQLPAELWLQRPVTAANETWVWLERQGPEQANDAMILERLALAISVNLERSLQRSRPPLEILIDHTTTQDQRDRAIRNLHLEPHQKVTIAAVPDLHGEGGSQRYQPVLNPSRSLTRAGISLPALPTRLAPAWEEAVTALELTSEFQPVMRADELGPLMLIDGLRNGQDAIQSLEQLALQTPWAVRTINALVATNSIRNAAKHLHIHHSTLNVRIKELSQFLGFDVRSPIGQTRLTLSAALLRLARPLET